MKIVYRENSQGSFTTLICKVFIIPAFLSANKNIVHNQRPTNQLINPSTGQLFTFHFISILHFPFSMLQQIHGQDELKPVIALFVPGIKTIIQ
jgi:hypothetical protein